MYLGNISKENSKELACEGRRIEADCYMGRCVAPLVKSPFGLWLILVNETLVSEMQAEV